MFVVAYYGLLRTFLVFCGLFPIFSSPCYTFKQRGFADSVLEKYYLLLFLDIVFEFM